MASSGSSIQKTTSKMSSSSSSSHQMSSMTSSSSSRTMETSSHEESHMEEHSESRLVTRQVESTVAGARAYASEEQASAGKIDQVYQMSDEEIAQMLKKKRNLVAFRGQVHGFNNHVFVKVKVSFKKPRVLRKIPVELRIGYIKITRKAAHQYMEENQMTTGRRRIIRTRRVHISKRLSRGDSMDFSGSEEEEYSASEDETDAPQHALPPPRRATYRRDDYEGESRPFSRRTSGSSSRSGYEEIDLDTELAAQKREDEMRAKAEAARLRIQQEEEAMRAQEEARLAAEAEAAIKRKEELEAEKKRMEEEAAEAERLRLIAEQEAKERAELEAWLARHRARFVAMDEAEAALIEARAQEEKERQAREAAEARQGAEDDAEAQQKAEEQAALDEAARRREELEAEIKRLMDIEDERREAAAEAIRNMEQENTEALLSRKTEEATRKREADLHIEAVIDTGDLGAAQQAKRSEKEAAAAMAREIEDVQLSFEEKELESHNNEEQLQITFEEMVAQMRRQAGLDERKWRAEMKDKKEAAAELAARLRAEALAAEQSALEAAERERLGAKAKAEAQVEVARQLDEAGIRQRLKEEEEKRIAEEAERVRLAAEAEAAAEAARLKAEADAAEAARLEEERRAAEAAAKAAAEEAEKQRILAEQAAEEARIKAEEEALKKKLEEEAAKFKAAQDAEEARLAAIEADRLAKIAAEQQKVEDEKNKLRALIKAAEEALAELQAKRGDVEKKSQLEIAMMNQKKSIQKKRARMGLIRQNSSMDEEHPGSDLAVSEGMVMMTTTIVDTAGGVGAEKQITTLTPRVKRKPGAYRNVATQTPVNTYYKGEKFWERYKQQKGVTDETDGHSSGSEREADIEDEFTFKHEKLDKKKRDALKKIASAEVEVKKEKKIAEIALETGLSLDEVAKQMAANEKHAEEEAKRMAEEARIKAEEEEVQRKAEEEAERKRLLEAKKAEEERLAREAVEREEAAKKAEEARLAAAARIAEMEERKKREAEEEESRKAEEEAAAAEKARLAAEEEAKQKAEEEARLKAEEEEAAAAVKKPTKKKFDEGGLFDAPAEPEKPKKKMSLKEKQELKRKEEEEIERQRQEKLKAEREEKARLLAIQQAEEEARLAAEAAAAAEAKRKAEEEAAAKKAAEEAEAKRLAEEKAKKEAAMKPVDLTAMWGAPEEPPEEKPRRKIKLSQEEEIKVVVDTSIQDKLMSRLKKSSTSSAGSNKHVTFSDEDEVQEFSDEEESKMGAMSVRRRKKDQKDDIDWNQMEPSKLDAMVMRKREGLDAEDIDWNDLEPMKMEPCVMRKLFKDLPEGIDWPSMEQSKLKDMIMRKREKDIEEGIDWNEIPEKAAEEEGGKMGAMLMKPRKRSTGEEIDWDSFFKSDDLMDGLLGPAKMDAMIMRKRNKDPEKEIDWNQMDLYRLEPMTMKRRYKDLPEDVDWDGVDASKLKDMVMARRAKDDPEGFDWPDGEKPIEAPKQEVKQFSGPPPSLWGDEEEEVEVKPKRKIGLPKEEEPAIVIAKGDPALPGMTVKRRKNSKGEEIEWPEGAVPGPDGEPIMPGMTMRRRKNSKGEEIEWPEGAVPGPDGEPIMPGMTMQRRKNSKGEDIDWPEGAEEDGMLDPMAMKRRAKDKGEDVDWGGDKKPEPKKALKPVSLFGDEPEEEEQPRRKKISLKKVEAEEIKVAVDDSLLNRLKKPSVEIPQLQEEEVIAPPVEEAVVESAVMPSFLSEQEKAPRGPVDLFGDAPVEEEAPKRKGLRKVSEPEPAITIKKNNALAEKAAALKKKKEEEEKKEQEEKENIDLRKNLSRRKSSTTAPAEEAKEETEAEAAARKAKEAKLAKEAEKIAEMERSIKEAEERMLAAQAGKSASGDLGFDQLAAMDAAAEAELKAQQEELAAKKAELAAKKASASMIPTGGEAVDLKNMKKGMKKAAGPVNLFGDDEPEVSEADQAKKKLRRKSRNQEEDIKIAVDTSAQDAMKARLAGLKKKEEAKVEEPAEPEGPSEEELARQEEAAAKAVKEKERMDALQAEIKAAEDAFLAAQTKRTGTDSASALGELDAMRREEEEEFARMKAELDAKKKTLKEASSSSFITSDEKVDMKAQMKGLKKSEKKEVVSTTDLFGASEEQEEIKSSRKGLRKRTTQEEEFVMKVDEEKDAMKARLASLKARKKSIDDKKKADEEADEAEAEMAKMKTALRKRTDRDQGEDIEFPDDEPSEAKEAMSGLKKVKEDVQKVDVGALMAEVELPEMGERTGAAALDLMAALSDDPLAQERAEQEARKQAKLDAEKAQQEAMSLFAGGEEEDVGARRKGLRKRAVQEEEVPIKIDSSDDIAARLQAKQDQLKKIEAEEKARLAAAKAAEEERLKRLGDRKGGLKKVEVKEKEKVADDDEAEMDEAAELRRKMRQKKEEPEESMKIDPDKYRREMEEMAARMAEIEAEQAAKAEKENEVAQAMAEYERLKQEEEELRLAEIREKEEAKKREQEELAAAMSSFYGQDEEDIGGARKGLRKRDKTEEAPVAIIEVNKDKEEMAARMAKLKEDKMKRMAEEREAEVEFEKNTARVKELMDMKAKMKSTGESEEDRKLRKKLEAEEEEARIAEELNMRKKLRKKAPQEEEKIKIEPINMDILNRRKEQEERKLRQKEEQDRADEERRKKLAAMLEDTDIEGREQRDLETGVDDIMAALAESERMELEERERLKAERDAKKGEVGIDKLDLTPASFIQKGDHESKVKEEAEAEAARLALEEEESKMMIEAMKRKQKEKAMAFDWDAYKKKEKAKQESDMFAVPKLKSKGPIEKKWEEEETYIIEEPEDDDDTPYIKLYLEMCEKGKTCDEYVNKGTCRHIYYINFDEFKHKNCPQAEEAGTCNCLRGSLWKWVARYDGEMELKLRAEVEFAEFDHVENCKTFAEHGACFCVVDVMNSFRTKKECWELAWMHRVEFDRFFDEGCAEYINQGTCGHTAGCNIGDFEHKGCAEYQENKKCNCLIENLDKCDSKFSGEMLIIRSEFNHIDCTQYEILGKCHCIEDMISRKVFYENYLREACTMKKCFMEPLPFEAERTMEMLASNVQLDEVGEIPDDHEDDGY